MIERLEQQVRLTSNQWKLICTANVADLLDFFDGGSGPQRIVATPGRGDEPAVWLLGSSGYSAQLAGMLGLPFSFAHHFSAAKCFKPCAAKSVALAEPGQQSAPFRRVKMISH